LICSYERFIGIGEVHITPDTSIIIDEAHYAKNVGAKRTKAIHQYVKEFNPRSVYLLSGTPIKNRIPEIYSLLMICSYGNPETHRLMSKYYNYWQFCEHFSNATRKSFQGRKITTYSGHKNLPELKEIMATCYLRRMKMEVDLPSMRDINIYLDMEDSEVDLDSLSEYELRGKVTPSMASRKAENALAKAPHTAKFCKDLIEENNINQVVVFCDHILSTEVMAKTLGVLPITGSTPMHERDRIVGNFIAGDCKYLVTTIGTSSTGLNLVNTHVMVFNSFPWVSGDLEQAKKRINRIGQEKDCLYYYMIAGEVDERILKVLNSKSKTISEVL
jgi:SNF2 family DNA or RNA helicase